jgi:hypothetical protein
MIVVKVQKPLVSTEPNPGYLIYGYTKVDRERRARIQHRLPKNVIDVMRTTPRAFFFAKWSDSANGWELGDRTSDKSW